MHRIKTSSIVVVFAFAIAPHVLGDESPLRVAPTDGVLVLRNGEVIQGKIARAGDRYFVTVSGGEIRIKVDDVAMVCQDIGEAYQQKRKSLAPNDIYGRIELAKWCLHHRMISQAAREMTEIAAADPKNPALPKLERQIETLLAVQATAEKEPAAEAPKSQPAEKAPTTDDLDAFVRYLPVGTVETYTTTIQPLLTNRCMTSGCHSVRSHAQMHLYRPTPGHRSSRRLTQRNLYAVLQYVDRNNPTDSPLLKTPLGPHGTARTPIFTSTDDPHYRQVLSWIQQLGRTGGENDAGPADRSARKTSSTGKIARRMSSIPTGSPASEFNSEPNSETGSHEPNIDAGNESPRRPGNRPFAGKPKAKHGKSAPSANSKEPARSNEPTDKKDPAADNDDGSADPFDPEVFNRRFSTPPPPSTANR